MPEHFGYPEHESVGEVVGKETYIVLTERFKQASAEPTFKEWMNIEDCFAKPGFNEEDFDKIEKDSSVNKVYSNGEFDTFLVRGESKR